MQAIHLFYFIFETEDGASDNKAYLYKGISFMAKELINRLNFLCP